MLRELNLGLPSVHMILLLERWGVCYPWLLFKRLNTILMLLLFLQKGSVAIQWLHYLWSLHLIILTLSWLGEIIEVIKIIATWHEDIFDLVQVLVDFLNIPIHTILSFSISIFFLWHLVIFIYTYLLMVFFVLPWYALLMCILWWCTIR